MYRKIRSLGEPADTVPGVEKNWSRLEPGHLVKFLLVKFRDTGADRQRCIQKTSWKVSLDRRFLVHVPAMADYQRLSGKRVAVESGE